MESGIIKIDVPEINFGNIPLTSAIRHQPSQTMSDLSESKDIILRLKSIKKVHQSFRTGCVKAFKGGVRNLSKVVRNLRMFF